MGLKEAAKALSQKAYMDSQYKSEIDDRISKTKEYDDSFKFIKINEGELNNTINIVDSSSIIDAFYKYREPDKKIAILDFANYTTPGGGFTKGVMQQEESICHASYLYNILSKQTSWYNQNKKNINKGLYANRALYIPDVRIITKGSQYCNIIVASSPNFKEYKGLGKEDLVKKTGNLEAVKSRIHFLRNIVQEEKIDILIAGAWGCGEFKQEPLEVAQIFKKEFSKSSLEKIVYAILSTNNTINIDAFYKIIGEEQDNRSRV